MRMPRTILTLLAILAISSHLHAVDTDQDGNPYATGSQSTVVFGQCVTKDTAGDLRLIMVQPTITLQHFGLPGLVAPDPTAVAMLHTAPTGGFFGVVTVPGFYMLTPYTGLHDVVEYQVTIPGCPTYSYPAYGPTWLWITPMQANVNVNVVMEYKTVHN